MKRRTVSLTLFVAVGLLALLAWQLRPGGRKPGAIVARSDYTLDDYQMTTLNERGEEAFTVEGPHLERDRTGKSLTLTQPRFSFPDKNGGRWNARSDRGWVAEKGVEVRLDKAVALVGPPTPRGEQTRIGTEQLRIFPKLDQARSDDTVTVTRADSILQGTGLRVDLKAHRVQLLSDVKGRYAPPR